MAVLVRSWPNEYGYERYYTVEQNRRYDVKGKKIIVLVVISFIIGYNIGKANVRERIVYQPKIEYRKDPDSVPKSALDKAISDGHKATETARKVSFDEGYESGFTQGIEHGKSLIMSEIDLRVQEAEKTNKNVPLFRVKRE